MVKKSNYDQDYLDANVEIYYPDCVGVAYVPIYPNEFGKGSPDWFPETFPPGFPSPHIFSGTNSHQAKWLYYTPSDIELQVRNLKQLGFNCLRIWTNYFIWNFFKNCETDLPPVSGHFTSSLTHFLDTCERERMNVGICLLEHYAVGKSQYAELDGVSPQLGSGDYDYATPAYINDAWLQVPGTDREVSGFLASGLGGNYLAASSYIVDVVNICKNYECITTYDICNAANESLSDSVELFRQCADLIRATDPNMRHKVFLNSEGMTPFDPPLALSNPISSHSSIDLVTTHPFFFTKRAWNEYMNIAFSGAIKYGKPFYGTECGFPGGFQRYEDMVAFSRARGQKGVGYTFWQAMCGHPQGNEQFGTGGGFLHYDGNLRDFLACKAVYEHALALGYRPSDLNLPNELPQAAYRDTNYDNEQYGIVGVRRICDNYLPYPGHPTYLSTSSAPFNNWIADRYGPDQAFEEVLNWRNRERFSEQANVEIAGDWYTRQYAVLNNWYLEFRTPFSDLFQKTTGTEWEIGILDFTIDAGQFGTISADLALSSVRDAIDVSGITQALDPATGDPNNLLFTGGLAGADDVANWEPYDDFFDDWFYIYEQILTYLEWTDNST